MPKIPIKIRKGKSTKPVAEELKVDLRNSLEPKLKQPRSSVGLFLVIFLVMVILGLSAYCFFLAPQKTPFADLIPQEAAIFALINQQEIYPQISLFNQEIAAKIDNYSEDIQLLFQEQIAFILLPANDKLNFPFALLGLKKASQREINQVLNEVETRLEDNYNFSSENYRQIKITRLKPLADSSSYFYCQIDKYFIIGNSRDCLEKIIDSIIGR